MIKLLKLLLLTLFLWGCSQSNQVNGNAPNLNPFLNVDLSQTSAVYVNQDQTAASLQYKVQSLLESFVESQAFASSPNTTLHGMVGYNEVAIHFTSTGAETLGGVTTASGNTGNTVAYIAVTGLQGVYGVNGICNTVFVKKSNSATQCLARLIVLAPGTAKNIESDASGRYLVYLDYAANLYRYDTTTGIESLLSSGVEEFSVNSDGDVLMAFNNGLGAVAGIYPGTGYLIASGGNIAPHVGTVTTINGTHGSQHFYFAGDPNGAGITGCWQMGVGSYCELIKSGSGATATFTIQPATDYPVPYCVASTFTCSIGWADSDMYLVQVTTGQSSFVTSNGLAQLVNGSTPSSGITGTLPSTVQNLNGVGTSIMVQATAIDSSTGLYKFDTGSNGFTTLLPAGQVSISSYDIDGSGNVTLAGVRASDNANIVASIPAGTTTMNVVSTPNTVPTSVIVLK